MNTVVDPEKISLLAPERRKTERRSCGEHKQSFTDNNLHMKNFYSSIQLFVMLINLFILITPWFMGIILAKGWEKVLAIFLPYAWYIVIEKLMIVNNLV